MTEQPPPMDPNGPPPPPPPGWGAPPPPPPPGYGAPPPGYGAPGYGPPPPGYATGTNTKAIWSLVCAIVGFLCGPVGVAGIVLGMQAKKEIAVTGQNGAGMAQAGFIVGIVSTALWVLWLIAIR
jgi:hypothetical protein